MSDASLQFVDVTFGFGDRTPLFAGLSCDLRNDGASAKIIALMGPSGVGKTTFCDLALGVRRPAKGHVRLGTGKGNVAVIPQKGVLFDELTVRENIECLKYSRTLGGSFREERVDSAAASLGLCQLLEDRTGAHALGGGEAQRVMLARIQTVSCDVLILDEPCSFLDNRVKGSFLDALRSTVDTQGLLALMVTHVWDEARLVADDVIFFNRQAGQSATLHRCSIAEAERRPPTVDALFAIHWPNCSVIDTSDTSLLANVPSAGIPGRAAFAGFFQRRQASQNASRLQRADASGLERAGSFCAFYDANGILVDSKI